jgi:hypothetical protein
MERGAALPGLRFGALIFWIWNGDSPSAVPVRLIELQIPCVRQMSISEPYRERPLQRMPIFKRRFTDGSSSLKPILGKAVSMQIR